MFLFIPSTQSSPIFTASSRFRSCPQNARFRILFVGGHSNYLPMSTAPRMTTANPLHRAASESMAHSATGEQSAGERATHDATSAEASSAHSTSADATSAEKVIELLTALPCASVLAELAAINPFHLAPASRIDYLTALERQTSWLQALMQRAIIAVAGRQASESDDPIYGVDEAEREDISTALRLSPSTAQNKIDIARALTNYLPNTCSALATGEISTAHATAIAREAASALNKGLPESVIFQLEDRAIAYAEFHTPNQVGSLVRNVIAKATPQEFEEIVADAREGRTVSCYNDVDGISTVVAILPAEGAQIVMNAIDAFILRAQQRCGRCGISPEIPSPECAHEVEVDALDTNRTRDMHRADALVEIASAYLSSTLDDVTPHRRPLTVNVTVDLPTLMGLAENPGQLAGYGAIPASVARQIAADARWKRFVTEPLTGNLLDFGRESYEPPQALKDFLIARDRTCRFPGCRRSAALSDLDHAQSWESGGQTSSGNLGALCRRHHRLKTHAGWSVESFSDGSCSWTSPHGKKFFSPARPLDEPI